jgi:tetratricopeptide (TPR) repeat protein
VPIWLGSGTREEVVPVRSIKQIVPEDMHQSESVIAIDNLEGDSAFYAAQARFVEAAESLEQAISLRRKFLGDNHPDFLAAIESYAVCCNIWGMQSLNNGRCTVSLEMLKKAEAMTEADNVPNFKRRVALRAATFNNLCCYFRDRGKSNAALQFAEKALKIEQHYKQAESPARTHLNYAVLLSTMGRNEEALEHIESAIAVLHDEERQLTYEQVDEHDELMRQETCSVLVLAHYNMWVENLRLNRHAAGLDCLQRAANIAVHKLSPSHPLAEKMQQSYVEAKQRLGLKVPGTPRTPRLLPKMAVTTSDGFHSTIEADHFHFNSREAHPWQKVQLEKASADMAQEILSQNRQITLRTSRPEPKPPPVSEKMPPRTRGIRQMRLHKQTYGTDHVGKELSGAWWDSHPKLQETKGFAGSPILQQQAHGVQPMVSMRSPRTISNSRKQTADVGTGADPKLQTGTSLASAMQEAAMSTASSWPPVPSSPGRAPVATLASSDGLESPHMVAAYEYHRRRMQMRECGIEDAEVDELALEPGRLEAISVLRNRLDTRRAKGLPTPTDLNKNQAATKIQAMTRGYQVRRWSIEELAREMRRQRALQGAEARGMPPPVGASDGKRRVAFKVIYAARRAYVEYAAAVKIQKVARGSITRGKLRRQIEQIANQSAAKVQASLRCWVAINTLKKRKKAAMKIQAWSRQVLACRRVAGIRRLAVLLTRVARGGFERCSLQEKHLMAVRIQRWIRGGKARVCLRKRLQCALQIQRLRDQVDRKG